MSGDRTTETLRATLLDAVEDVRTGKLPVEQAKAMVMLAEKVIGTAKLELDAAMTLAHLKAQEAAAPGPLVLAGPKPKLVAA